MGSEKDMVEYRIDDGKWKKMQYQSEYDLAYVYSLYEWDLSEELISGRRPNNPVPSTHLWRGNVPTNLEPGDHTIEVKATDMFGRSFIQKSSYRIEEQKDAQ